jgi:Methyltransferase domain
VFAELGHTAVGLEGAARFAVMARARSSCEVWQQDFLKLELPNSHFDGVFANAALFHVPSQELPRVLLEIDASLKCCSAPTRAAITRRAGTADATACTMILKLGAATCQLPGSSSLLTITAQPACRANSSPGWQASGAGSHSEEHRFYWGFS